MLKQIKTKNGYNVYDDTKQKNILKYDYDNITIQQYGIVAIKNTKGTFLDKDFHLYDKKGNFLFSVHENYDGNYVVSHSFSFHEKYICMTTSCTADYDKWDHGTSYSHTYLHLNGDHFNVGDYSVNSIDEFNGNIYVLDVSKGLWSSDTIRDTFFYDMENRKILLSKNQLMKDIKDLINEISHQTKQKLRLMLVEKIKQEATEAISKYNLTEQEIKILKNDINTRIKYFIKNGGFIDLYGEDIVYDENNKIIPIYKNLEKVYNDINYLGHWGDKIDSSYDCAFYYYPANCYKVDVNFKKTEIQNISEEVDKCFYGRDYVRLNLFTISPHNLEIKINTKTLNRLKNLYTKLTNKPCPKLNIESLDFKQIQENELNYNN